MPQVVCRFLRKGPEGSDSGRVVCVNGCRRLTVISQIPDKFAFSEYACSLGNSAGYIATSRSLHTRDSGGQQVSIRTEISRRYKVKETRTERAGEQKCAGSAVAFY